MIDQTTALMGDCDPLARLRNVEAELADRLAELRAVLADNDRLRRLLAVLESPA